MLQNPPSIPTLALARLVALCTRAHFIIDWHNFGYTILGLSRGTRHPLVRVARVYEKWWGRQAHAHLCVTRAMQRWLRDNWNITATVLYDRAPASFTRLSTQQQHELLTRLHADGTLASVDGWISEHGQYDARRTICTEYDGKGERNMHVRMALFM